MRLVYESTGKPVEIGDRVKSFRGEPYEVVRIEGPRRSGSTGRLWVRNDSMRPTDETSYFPSVFGAEWSDSIH